MTTKGKHWKNPKVSKLMKKNNPMNIMENRKKISKTKKKRWKEDKYKLSSSCFKKGHKQSDEINAKKGLKREKHPKWKGGISKIMDMIRGYHKVKEWRKKVFERDNFTCQKCNNGGYIEAHHINPIREIIKESEIKTYKDIEICKILWDINNGITYCINCHKEVDIYRR